MNEMLSDEWCKTKDRTQRKLMLLVKVRGFYSSFLTSWKEENTPLSSLAGFEIIYCHASSSSASSWAVLSNVFILGLYSLFNAYAADF